MDDMILASAGGAEERVVTDPYDIEIGTENTFELSIPVTDWAGDLAFGKRLYIPGTEYGGIIKCIASDTSKETVFVRGYTWRGYLSKKFVHGTYSGELNQIIGEMLGEYDGVFKASGNSSGVTANITLSEYTSIWDALKDIISAAGKRLCIKYVQTKTGGYAELSVVPAVVYGDEVSQDSLVDFTVEDNRMTVNHLIVSNGTNHVDLYVDTQGAISTTKTQIGVDEITDFYEAGDNDDLVEKGTERLSEMIAYKTMSATFGNANDIDLNIGDLVTGVDYVTGITITKPITSKIITYQDNVLTIDYGIEDEGE